MIFVQHLIFFLFPLPVFVDQVYLNQDWFEMSKEEAQKMYDKELNFMLDNADKAKKG